MIDRIFLLNRLYEAVLDLTGIPRSQLDMLLENPDAIKHVDDLRSLIVSRVDVWDAVAKDVHAVPR